MNGGIHRFSSYGIKCNVVIILENFKLHSKGDFDAMQKCSEGCLFLAEIGKKLILVEVKNTINILQLTYCNDI